uniref:hypothetical protein n=1 Tax=Alkalibacillus haloalkaliphilus TaxID=94136 RepID=UPI00058CAB45
EEVLKAWEDWKRDAMREVDRQVVFNQSDINSTRINWNSRNLSMSVSLQRAIDLLWIEYDYFTNEQRNELSDRKNEVVDAFEELTEDVDKKMNELSDQTIEEARQSIDETFEREIESSN